MGVTLERVQFKFASIIGELCSEPRVLSQFAVWLDLRLAEYKLKGSISLECSNDKPDPTWLSGIKEEKLITNDEPYSVSLNKVRKLTHREPSTNSAVLPRKYADNGGFKGPVSLTDDFTEDVSQRLSPNILVKRETEETPVVFPSSLPATFDNQQSSNRRKRQAWAVVRNSPRSDFLTPGSSEDDNVERFYSSNIPQAAPLYEDDIKGDISQSNTEDSNIDQSTFTSAADIGEGMDMGDNLPAERVCSVCGEIFNNNQALLIHSYVHKETNASSSTGLLFCATCDLHMPPLEAFSHHELSHIIQETKPSDDPIICQVCGKIFQQKRYLREHMRLHADTPKRQCPKCGMLFVWRASLNKHVKKCKKNLYKVEPSI